MLIYVLLRMQKRDYVKLNKNSTQTSKIEIIKFPIRLTLFSLNYEKPLHVKYFVDIFLNHFKL